MPVAQSFPDFSSESSMSQDNSESRANYMLGHPKEARVCVDISSLLPGVCVTSSKIILGPYVLKLTEMDMSLEAITSN